MTSPRFAVDIVPVLSRGRHRSPRNGACFMEYASYLAGERWSDHPSCTHPALASLARLVNDWTSDAARSRLAPMIPTVIGLQGGRHAIELVVAIRAAVEAMAVASEERQRLLAIGLIRAIAHLRDTAPREYDRNAAMVRAALDRVPLAEEWAERHIAALRPPRIRSTSPMSDAIVAISVAGIGEACADDRDARLLRLLEIAIAEFMRTGDDTARDGSEPAAIGAGAGTKVEVALL